MRDPGPWWQLRHIDDVMCTIDVIARSGDTSICVMSHRTLGLLACQVFPADMGRDAQMMMRQLANVDHPAIARLVLFGECSRNFLLGVEYSSRESIHERCKKLSNSEKVIAIASILSGLAHIHELRLVHGSISPEFVMIADPSRVKLVHFPSMSSSSWCGDQGRGEGVYTAPEVLRGGRVTVQSDIFSMGALIYWFATGEHAFSVSEAGVASDAGPRVEASLSAWPQGMSALVRRMWAASPDDRPGNVVEVWRELERSSFAFFGGVETGEIERLIRPMRPLGVLEVELAQLPAGEESAALLTEIGLRLARDARRTIRGCVDVREFKAIEVRRLVRDLAEWVDIEGVATGATGVTSKSCKLAARQVIEDEMQLKRDQLLHVKALWRRSVCARVGVSRSMMMPCLRDFLASRLVGDAGDAGAELIVLITYFCGGILGDSGSSRLVQAIEEQLGDAEGFLGRVRQIVFPVTEYGGGDWIGYKDALKGILVRFAGHAVLDLCKGLFLTHAVQLPESTCVLAAVGQAAQLQLVAGARALGGRLKRLIELIQAVLTPESGERDWLRLSGGVGPPLDDLSACSFFRRGVRRWVRENLTVLRAAVARRRKAVLPKCVQWLAACVGVLNQNPLQPFDLNRIRVPPPRAALHTLPAETQWRYVGYGGLFELQQVARGILPYFRWVEEEKATLWNVIRWLQAGEPVLFEFNMPEEMQRQNVIFVAPNLKFTFRQEDAREFVTLQGAVLPIPKGPSRHVMTATGVLALDAGVQVDAIARDAGIILWHSWAGRPVFLVRWSLLLAQCQLRLGRCKGTGLCLHGGRLGRPGAVVAALGAGSCKVASSPEVELYD